MQGMAHISVTLSKIVKYLRFYKLDFVTHRSPLRLKYHIKIQHLGKATTC